MSEPIKIWSHGYGCTCCQCQNEDSNRPYLVLDYESGDFVDFELPETGEVVTLEDQHGTRYKLERAQ